MFKKNEESEWTRFSRALGGKDQSEPDAAAPEAEAADEEQSAPVPVTSGAATAPNLPPEPTPAPFVDDSVRPFDSPEVTSMGGQAVDPQPYDAWASDPPATAVATAQAPPSSWSSTSHDDADGESVVGAGTTIEGTLRSEHSIRIRGAVQGEVESKRTVFVEDAARVNAKVTAEGIAVSGEVNGELHCPGRVEIAPNGRVTGEISAGSLIMQEGAYFEGHLKMLNRQGGRDVGTDQ